MIAGRKQTNATIKKLSDKTNPCLWMHCASLGEFEQGRPLLELIRKQQPQKRIILSFFSPSGYEVRKDYPIADEVYYMPFDTPKNSKYFINQINPDTVIFVKYELWYYHLKYLKNNAINTYLISATFRPKQWLFKFSRKFSRNLFSCFTHIFVQDKISSDLLSKLDINQVSISGDTRIDRVIEISKQKFEDPILESFAKDSNCIIAGSTWPQDEEILLNCVDSESGNLKIIIAPHVISDKRLSMVEEMTNLNTIRYSQANSDNIHKYKILIIDNMGMLSKIYKFGSIAYVGGGFGKGIHNTLEAAVYGIPVIFGPNYTKFNEAKSLIELGGAFSIKSENELKSLINKLFDSNTLIRSAGTASKNYVFNSEGIVQDIFSNLQRN